jgi:ribosomal protein L16 Arg81 hydroxylase
MIDKKLIQYMISNGTYVHTKEAINPDFLSWEDVAEYFIPFTTRNVDLIGSEGKIDIPKNGIYQYRDFIIQHIAKNHTFCISKFINVNPKTFRLFEFFCDLYPERGIDFHLYGGLDEKSNYFPAHNDLADNYIIQIDGQCEWTIYKEQATFDEALHYKILPENTLAEEYKSVLNPGDVLYIPSGKYHKCVPLGKRLSLSVPIL